MWTKDPYVFRTTSSGLNVYDLYSGSLLNFVAFPQGLNAVWANETTVYVATSVSGVCSVDIGTITGSASFSVYKSFPEINSNDVSYIHGAGDYLLIATTSGIDRYDTQSGDREYVVVDQGVYKCFQASSGDYYYVVNPNLALSGLDYNIFGWQYVHEVLLSSPIEEDDYQFYFELDTSFYGYVTNTDSVRIIDDSMRVVPYFIQLWDGVNSPQIWTKLNSGVSKFYIIYGCDFVTAKSSGEDVFLFFDDFEATTLSDKWAWSNGGTTSNFYTISDSIFRFDTNNNNYTVSLTTADTFGECILDYSVKYVTPSSYTEDLDWMVSFVNGGPRIYIGASDTEYESPHYFIDSDDNVLYGNKLMSSTFKTNSIFRANDYQASVFDEEVLTSSGTFVIPESQIKFYYNSDSSQPDAALDWVRVRKNNLTQPNINVGSQKSITHFFVPTKLCAVYNTSEGFIYNENGNDNINAFYINDIHVTENTSIFGGNVICLATSWGAYILEEKRGDENNCRKRVYLISS